MGFPGQDGEQREEHQHNQQQQQQQPAPQEQEELINLSDEDQEDKLVSEPEDEEVSTDAPGAWRLPDESDEEGAADEEEGDYGWGREVGGTLDQDFGAANGGAVQSMDPEQLPKIRVVVRKRPLNKKEASRREEDIVSMDPPEGALTVHEQKQKVDLTTYTEHHDFMFDDIYTEGVGNADVYASAVQPLVKTLFNGGKVTCFAYGQTGSGKTYTMQPLPTSATEDVLALMRQPGREDLELHASFFEIYGGKVFDLLNARKKLVIREDGKQKVNIVGVQEHCIESTETMRALIEHGNAARSTGQTGANDDSSRSHAILQLCLKKPKPKKDNRPLRPRSALARRQEDAEPTKVEVGKFSFIDLAGSERGADTTDNDKQTRLEGAEINKSLLALKECIRALDLEHRHVPFRGSKLTEVLRDSFVGAQSRTVMIAAISPGSGSCEHTLNTLRYAFRVKELRHGGGSNSGTGPSSVDPHKDQRHRDSSAHPSAPASQPAKSAATAAVAQGASQAAAAGQGSANPRTTPFSQLMQERERSASPVKKQREQEDGAWQPGAEAAQQQQLQRGQQQQVAAQRSHGHGVEGLTALSRQVGPRARGNQENVPPKRREYASARQAKQEHGDGEKAAVREGAQEGNEEDRELLVGAHDELMNTILEEEEEVISAHRKLIDDTMEQIKREMVLLEEVDRPGSAIDAYVRELNELLQSKAGAIQSLQDRLATFERHLKEEEILSRTVGPRE